MKHEWSNLPEWVVDNAVSLVDLAELISNLQRKYGKRSLIEFTAGANNITVLIAPSKKNVKIDNLSTSQDKLKNV